MTKDSQFKHLALETNYLEDYKSPTRSKTLPWDGYARSELLTHEEARRLTELEGAAYHKQLEKITSEEHIDDYIATLFGLLAKDLPKDRSDISQYCLVLIGDLCSNDVFLERLLKQYVQKDSSSYLQPLLKNLIYNFNSNDDEVIPLLGLYDLIYILIQYPEIKFDIANDVYNKLFQSLSALLECAKSPVKFLGVELLSEVLTVKEFRSKFLEVVDQNSIRKLIGHLFTTLNAQTSASSNAVQTIQAQYKILLSIWCLSFSADYLKIITEFFQPEFLTLLRLAKISIKEKIIRMIISILVNITAIPNCNALSIENLKFLILTGDIVPTLNNLNERKWQDQDLIDDLDLLKNRVQEIYSQLTSFDEYLQELNSKNFKNSPVHTNDEFFLDNLHYFQDSNYKIFKQLLALLDENTTLESKSLVYILSDIGKILKLDSKAIAILTKTNKKTKIMELLNHKNSEVRYEALKATQFIVSQTFKN